MSPAMRKATRIGAPVALMILAVGLLLTGFMIGQRPMAMADPEPTPLSTVAVAEALARVGVTPLTLAAAGVSDQAAGLIIADVGAYLENHEGSPGAEDIAYGAARSQRDRLRSLARAGTASMQDLAAIPAAESALQSFQAALDATLGAIWDAAAAHLTNDQAALIARLREVPAVFRGSVFPIQFGAAEWTDAQWVALREALAAERIAAGDGEVVDPAVATLLAAARAEAGVSAAAANIDVRLSGLQTAWSQAMSSLE